MTVRYTDARNPWPTLGAFHWGWLGLLALACALASIHPLDPAAYLMHQAGTVVGVMLLMWLTQIGKVSKVGFALTIGFILIHVLGAHYLYSFVPYNEWSKQYLGWDMDGYFGWSRNMYDRLVHFSYGLLLYRLMMDVFSTWFTASPRGRVSLLVIQFVMASSVFYEFIEWWIAMGMSPEAAESYNGQQGDMWDAHKDMALATLGAMMAWVLERLIYTVKRG
jgi:putative membrane protein